MLAGRALPRFCLADFPVEVSREPAKDQWRHREHEENAIGVTPNQICRRRIVGTAFLARRARHRDARSAACTATAHRPNTTLFRLRFTLPPAATNLSR